MKRLLYLALAPLLFSACQSVPTYGNVSDITNLNGVAQAPAFAALRDRGYQRVINFGQTSVWWNSTTSTCAQITVTGGGVSDVQSVPASDCSR